jgi:hypothetical protein
MMERRASALLEEGEKPASLGADRMVRATEHSVAASLMVVLLAHESRGRAR